MPSLEPRERFKRAAHVLATHPGAIEQRLKQAAIELALVRPQDLPEELRGRFDRIHYSVRRMELALESGLSTTLVPSVPEAVADEILDMWEELHES